MMRRWRPEAPGAAGKVTGAKQTPPHWANSRMRLHITTRHGVNIGAVKDM